jgi:hypothetical protein
LVRRGPIPALTLGACRPLVAMEQKSGHRRVPAYGPRDSLKVGRGNGCNRPIRAFTSNAGPGRTGLPARSLPFSVRARSV